MMKLPAHIKKDPTLSTDKQKLFVHYYMETNNALKAMSLAGYKPDASRASQLKKRHAYAIQEGHLIKAQDFVGPIFKELTRIALHGKRESDRIKAAKDILDRVGYKPVERQHVKVEEIKEKTDQEIQAELKELLAVTNGKQ